MGCLRPACASCLDEKAGPDLCESCGARRRRQRGARLRSVAIATSVSLSALGVVVWGASGYLQHSVVEGPLHKQEEALTATPCARDAVVGLLQEQMKLGNPRSALEAAQSFQQRCGPFRKLARYTYGAHMQLHEYERAAIDASSLIEDNPEDKDYRWWRGQAFEEAGALDKAAADYQYAISIQPLLMRVPMNLATVYEKLHRPCDALFTVEQYAQHYPAIRSDAAVQQRMKRLDEQGGCQRLAGAGRALIRFTPGSRGILVSARLNDRVEAQFIVDTGATMVAITRQLGSQLGIAWNEADTVLMGTAGGVRTAQLVALDAVEVQGARAERVEAAIADELPPGIDGLLGLSFLSRFVMYLDEAQGTLELAARPGAPTVVRSRVGHPVKASKASKVAVRVKAAKARPPGKVRVGKRAGGKRSVRTAK